MEYGQRNICAIKGSSVVIPCSFYYPKKQEVQSVKWAHGRSHIYKGPFIYDSESNYTSSRYQYIGDTQHNCSFKIHQVERNDSGKHAFRFSTISNNDLQEWTGSVGSQLKVVGEFSFIVMSRTVFSSALESAKFKSITLLL